MHSTDDPRVQADRGAIGSSEIRTAASTSPSLRRVALRAAGLLIVIPMLFILYLFREHLTGKEIPLLLTFAVSALGFYVLWSVIRTIIDIQNNLRGIARGDARSIDIRRGPAELREMAEIIGSLNRLTIEFRENAAQLERFIYQFGTLAELTEITAKVPDIHELLDLVLKKALAATNAKRGSTMLLQEDGDLLEIVAAVGWDSAPADPVRLRDSVAHAVIESGQPLLCTNIESAGPVTRPNDVTRYSTPSYLIMPIKTKAGTVGVVCLADKQTGGEFTPHDQQFLTVMFGQIGYAVENARLLKHARESAQNLKETVESQQVQIQHAQRQIIEAEKLSALGQLAGGVAHDFNNLIQAIAGYACLAQEGLPQTDKRYLDIEQVRNAASRASLLTRQLLAFGRRQVLQKVDLPIDQVVDDLLKIIRPVLGERIEIEFERGADVGTVHADPRQLEQVLMNLCINARDAMPRGGRIRIESRALLADEAFCKAHPLLQPGSYAVTAVSDTGTGMDQETVAQIFEPFFTTKAVGKGTGLGLSTSYGIVKQHGGLIEVQSAPSKGTTFTVYLPTVHRPAASIVDTIEGSVRGGSETVLLAEDEEIVRNLSERVLREAGYDVMTAVDGEDAVEVYAANADAIALVILDIVMPRMDGIMACHKIREIRDDVPFLFTSGYSVDVIDTGFLQCGGHGFIEKPVSAHDLLQKVRDILGPRNHTARAA